MYDICVIGLGYIGLPTSSMFAARGKTVIGVDIRQQIVDSLNKGEVVIEEPDLDLMVRAAVQSGNLQASTEPEEAGVYIIAVPTPFCDRVEGEVPTPDLSYVESASRALAKVVTSGAMIILESTSPVGTTDSVKEWVESELLALGRSEVDLKSLDYVHCPERILPGQMLAELVTNDRIVGGLTPGASARAEELYRIFCNGEIIQTDAKTAEMVKLTENASRDCSIAFANELSMVCDDQGISVWEVIRLANHHPRVNILRPGAGVGGHCIAVDPWFIVSSSNGRARLMQCVREINDSKPDYIVERVVKHSRKIVDPTIVCLGVTFKPNVDDTRNSPAMEIVEKLADADLGSLVVVEPNIESLPMTLVNKGVALVDLGEAIQKADVIVALVSHREFEALEPDFSDEAIFVNACGLFK